MALHHLAPQSIRGVQNYCEEYIFEQGTILLVESSREIKPELKVKKMEGEQLIDAAKRGCVQTLQKLLQQDEHILYRYMSECPLETPLHISAMLGHLEFTREVLTNMPRMVNELDFKNSTPLHVATVHGHFPTVRELLLSPSVNPERCFAEDGKGRNPVHIAVIKGHIDILKELVRFRPEAVQGLLEDDSTILHLCVKHYQLDALKVILEVIPNDAGFVNFKDKEGFTILHLAVAKKQTKVVKFLLQEHRKVDANAVNNYGKTAWDIILTLGRKDIEVVEIAECLQQVRGLEAESVTGSMQQSLANVVAESKDNDTGLITRLKNLCFSKPHGSKSEKKRQLEEGCNTLMIVASIIANFSFQALLQPPFTPPPPNNPYPPPLPSNDASEEVVEYYLGHFLLANTFSFSAAIFVIVLLISGLPLTSRLFVWILRIIIWIAVYASALTYSLVISIRYSAHDWASAGRILAYVVWILAAILTLGNAIRILFKTVKCFRKLMKKGRTGANSNAQYQGCV